MWAYSLSLKNPDLASVVTIGNSYEGHPMHILKVEVSFTFGASEKAMQFMNDAITLQHYHCSIEKRMCDVLYKKFRQILITTYEKEHLDTKLAGVAFISRTFSTLIKEWLIINNSE